MLKGEIVLRRAWPLYLKLTFIICLLTGLGLITVYNATYIFAAQNHGNAYHYFNRALFYSVVGLAGFFLVQKVSLEKLRRLGFLSLLCSLFLLFLVVLLGKEVRGAQRWLSLGPIAFQPSEFVKISVILYLSDLLTRKEQGLYHRPWIFFPALGVILVALGLIFKQPDLGTTLVIAFSVLALFYLAGMHLKFLVPVTGLLMLVGGYLTWISDYRRSRVVSILNPWGDVWDTTLQISQSLTGVGSGGIWGVGPGQGRQKLFFLPDAHTDYIYANIAEEFGLVGSVVVAGIFLALVYFGLQAALRCRDRFSYLLAGGLTALIGLQAFINIGVVLGIVPTTGLTLPFISYGGSSLVFTLLASGMLVNIARRLPPEEVPL